MDKKLYRTLANLAKATDSRDDESLRDLADSLTSAGPNELKSLFAQWLEEHGADSACDVPDDGDDTMIMNDHDTDLLKRLMNG